MPNLEEFNVTITSELVVRTTEGIDGAIRHAVTKARQGFNEHNAPLSNPSHIVGCEIAEIRSEKRVD
jgi:hypothetical protein